MVRYLTFIDNILIYDEYKTKYINDVPSMNNLVKSYAIYTCVTVMTEIARSYIYSYYYAHNLFGWKDIEDEYGIPPISGAITRS